MYTYDRSHDHSTTYISTYKICMYIYMIPWDRIVYHGSSINCKLRVDVLYTLYILPYYYLIINQNKLT